MNSRTIYPLLLVMALALGGRDAAAQPVSAAGSAVPTIDQLTAQLDSNPQEVLRGVARLLAMKGPAGLAQDRYALLMLRGEASLRTRALPPAAEAFAQAAKETTDPAKRSAARANEILARRAKANGYLPKVTTQPSAGAAPAQPIAMISPQQRKAAMSALFIDAMVTLKPKLQASQNATNLTPIMELAPSLNDLRCVELAASESDAQTKEVAATLGQRAHAMIDASLSKMQVRTEECWSAGTRKQYSTDGVGNRRTTNYNLAGLTSIEQNDLKGVIATCTKLQPVAKDLAEVTGSAELGADVAAAQKLLARAKEVLEFDYSSEGRNSPTPTGGQTPRQPPPPGTGNR